MVTNFVAKFTKLATHFHSFSAFSTLFRNLVRLDPLTTEFTTLERVQQECIITVISLNVYTVHLLCVAP